MDFLAKAKKSIQCVECEKCDQCGDVKILHEAIFYPTFAVLSRNQGYGDLWSDKKSGLRNYSNVTK